MSLEIENFSDFLDDRSHYLVDEKTLSSICGYNIPYPIRLFQLQDLGIHANTFRNDIAPTFENLHWDSYDVIAEKVEFLKVLFPQKIKHIEQWKLNQNNSINDLIVLLTPTQREHFDRIQPYRKRAIATFVLQKNNNEWKLTREHTGSFKQENNKFNNMNRQFQEISSQVTTHPGFIKLLNFFCGLIKNIHRPFYKMLIHCHQVSTVAVSGWPGKNAPEGLHQDGADYIVSAIVIDKAHIRGGKSMIYFGNKEMTLLEHTLDIGEGIFQADLNTKLYHDVTPIFPSNPHTLDTGIRNIIGFDFKIIEG